MNLSMLLTPIHQSEAYHHFANHSQHFGIPNFWNVISNAAFLVVAVLAWRRLKPQALSERWMLVAGIGLTAFGSASYHAQPSDARLVWDRLPMTIVFMCVLTGTIGERVNAQWARRLLWPLLAVGGLSVVYWRLTGDLRPYVVVQFFPLIAVPVMLAVRSNVTGTSLAAQWGMIGFYVLAKVAELLDGRLAGLVPAGAHAWKHVLAAAGLPLYTRALGATPVDSNRALPSDTPSMSCARRTSRGPLDFLKR
jgi:hypothetical protein